MGFPAGSYIGFASTSILDVAIPGKSAPDTGVPFAGVSFLTAGSFVATSLVVLLWGIFRMSLYRD
jgi:hypothetical protein